MKKQNLAYTIMMVFLVTLALFSVLQRSIFTKEVEYNRTVEVKEQVAVHNPGRSGLLISGDEEPSATYVTKNVTVKENVSLLSYWLRNLG